MDFASAIKAHQDWKMKLYTYIAKPNGSLKADVVSKDDQCPLGQWIHGEGKKFANAPEFARLVSEHAKFHKCAGDVIRKIDAGQKEEAEKMLKAGSEYMSVSTECVSLIRRIEETTKKG